MGASPAPIDASLSVLQKTINILKREKIVLNTFLSKELRKSKEISKLNRSTFRYYLKKAIEELKKAKAIKIKRISKNLFEIHLVNLYQALDLIHKTPARNSHQSPSFEEQSQQKPSSDELLHSCILPSRKIRASHLWRELDELRLKERLDEYDKEKVVNAFELWLNDAKSRFLIFKDDNGELRIMKAENRFTSKRKAVEQIKKLEEAFKIASQNNWEGVFLTLTLPPIFPQKVQQWILSFLLHRIKAYIRKKQKKTVLHIRINEPHGDFRLHLHVILFGTSFLMKKHALTRYLNKHIINFLSNLGEHYKRTINKNATDEQIIALNKYGKKLLRKYRAYKRQNPRLAGPINYITAIKVKEGSYTFANPPEDAKRRTAKDGGFSSVLDYVKFYVAKNVAQAKEIADEKKPVKAKTKELAFYWFARLPFYTLSPVLRPEKPLRVPADWRYIGSVSAEELSFVLEQRFNLIQY